MFYIGPKNVVGEMEIQRKTSRSSANGRSRNADSTLEVPNGVASKKGMVLPFTPLAMSFDSVNYFVDVPRVIFTVPYFTHFTSSFFFSFKHIHFKCLVVTCDHKLYWCN